MVLLASDYDKSRFLKADDLEGEKKFRIKDATEEEVGERKERKLVVWFTNDKRGLVLNRTNNRVLRGAFGDDTAAWVNKIIIVFSMMVEMRGKLVKGLRVRIPPPKHGSATTAVKPSQPSSGNGQTVMVKPTATPPAQKPEPVVTTEVDPELADDPKLSLSEELDDDISF
jgi:hypothetical protein